MPRSVIRVDGGIIPWNMTTQVGAKGDAGPSSGGSISSVNGKTGTVTLSQDDVGDGTTYKRLSATNLTKLNGVATGATANQSDATTNAAIAAAQATADTASSAATSAASAASSALASADAARDDLAFRQYVILWDAATSTWSSPRPDPADVPMVQYRSTNDPAATAPTDLNLQIGDGWKRHPDAPDVP